MDGIVWRLGRHSRQDRASSARSPKLKSVPVVMSPLGQYFVGRLLMLRERLSYEQWSGFERSADVMCDSVLERMPVDHPGVGGPGQPP